MTFIKKYLSESKELEYKNVWKNFKSNMRKAEKGIDVFKKAIKTVKDSVFNILDSTKQSRVIKVVQKIEDIVPKYSV